MPEVLEFSDVMPDILPMQRSPGTHISQLIHRLAVRAGMYEESEEGEKNVGKLQLGTSIEWALIKRWREEHPGRFEEIGELEFDGMYGTPDLLELSPVLAVHEMKLSWMSRRRLDGWDSEGGDGEAGRRVLFEGKLKKFWWQVMAYVWMLRGFGMDVREGVLHVWFVNGRYDWGVGGEAQYAEWRVGFGEEELRKNWEMLKREERRMLDGR